MRNINTPPAANPENKSLPFINWLKFKVENYTGVRIIDQQEQLDFEKVKLAAKVLAYDESLRIQLINDVLKFFPEFGSKMGNIAQASIERLRTGGLNPRLSISLMAIILSALFLQIAGNFNTAKASEVEEELRKVYTAKVTSVLPQDDFILAHSIANPKVEITSGDQTVEAAMGPYVETELIDLAVIETEIVDRIPTGFNALFAAVGQGIPASPSVALETQLNQITERGTGRLSVVAIDLNNRSHTIRLEVDRGTGEEPAYINYLDGDTDYSSQWLGNTFAVNGISAYMGQIDQGNFAITNASTTESFNISSNENPIQIVIENSAQAQSELHAELQRIIDTKLADLTTDHQDGPVQTVERYTRYTASYGVEQTSPLEEVTTVLTFYGDNGLPLGQVSLRIAEVDYQGEGPWEVQIETRTYAGTGYETDVEETMYIYEPEGLATPSISIDIQQDSN